MLNIKSFFVVIAVVVFLSVTSQAQQTISTEKRVLIQEFRELTGVQNLSAKAEFSSAEVTASFLSLIEQDKELTDSQKQDLKKHIAEAKERLEKEIRDYFADRATMKQLSDEVAFQLYDQNFTEAELRELITFYRTPTGQKSAKFLSTVNAETRKAFGEAFKQKLQEFAGLKVEEENELLKQKIREAKSKKNEE